MDAPSDPELLRRCLDGDAAAWTLLVERYADLVYGVARRSGIAAADAGDVAQEVFLALLRSLPRLRRTDRLLGWILKTARREAWRQSRRGRAVSRRQREVARPEKDDAPPPDATLAHLERDQTVREAFQALGERCRRLLDLLFFVDRRPPYEEIAESLGIAVGSIGPTRARCLEKLKTALAEGGFAFPDPSGPPHVSDRGRRASGRRGAQKP